MIASQLSQCLIITQTNDKGTQGTSFLINFQLITDALTALWQRYPSTVILASILELWITLMVSKQGPPEEGHCHLTSDQCGCVKLVVGSWSLSRFFIFSEFFSGLCLCSSSGSYSYSSSCSVLVPLLVLLPGSRLLMMRSPVLFLVALVLVLAADQKICPKERHGESPLSPLGTSAKPSS